MKMRNSKSTAVQLRRACGQGDSLGPSAALFRADRLSDSGRMDFVLAARDACAACDTLRGYLAALVICLLRRPRKHRFHLGLQRRGVERLDDVVADSGLLGRNDVFGL